MVAIAMLSGVPAIAMIASSAFAQDDESLREAREAGEAQPSLPAQEAREAREALPATRPAPHESIEMIDRSPSASEPRGPTLKERYLDAARRGDLAALKLCLDQGVDPRVKGDVGRSALALAVRDARSLEVADFLRARDLPLDEPDDVGRTPLHEASGNGDPALVAWLLMHGAKPGSRDSQGRTPLHDAALAGNDEVVLLLLTAGSDVNARDSFGDTPLACACSRGLDEVAGLLVDKGADPSLKDGQGRTARQRAPAAATFCRSLPDPGPAK